MKRPKIRTQCICPPIPDRSRDWRAWYDGAEESGCYGEGATEEGAIADLRRAYAALQTEESGQ